MLVDVRSKGITGKQAEEFLGQGAMTVNRNTIPNDPASPFVTSGIRLGTAALTTRGMGEPEMVAIAALIALIASALSKPDEANLRRVRREVEGLAAGFPLYQTAGRRTAAA
jgi:glycine hydroxymethyltransferase